MANEPKTTCRCLIHCDGDGAHVSPGFASGITCCRCMPKPEVLRRYWISWYDAEEDYRPLHDPPVEGIIGWWNSGETMDDPPRVTLCALVSAYDLDEARLIIGAEWPEFSRSEERFAEEKSPTFLPGDRFPLDGWMKERADA